MELAKRSIAEQCLTTFKFAERSELYSNLFEQQQICISPPYLVFY